MQPAPPNIHRRDCRRCRCEAPIEPATASGDSVRGGLIEDNGKADDLTVAEAEIAGHDQLVGQILFVVGAVVLGTHNYVAVVVDDLADVHRDAVADELLSHEGPDSLRAPDLAAIVVDECVRCERRDDPVSVDRVDCGDVLGQNWWQLVDDLTAHWGLLSGVPGTCRAGSHNGASRGRRLKSALSPDSPMMVG